MTASQEGHVEVVDSLLRHGATVDLQCKVSLTPVQSSLTFNLSLEKHLSRVSLCCLVCLILETLLLT